jgi:hypothetical protein
VHLRYATRDLVEVLDIDGQRFVAATHSRAHQRPRSLKVAAGALLLEDADTGGQLGTLETKLLVMGSTTSLLAGPVRVGDSDRTASRGAAP